MWAILLTAILGNVSRAPWDAILIGEPYTDTILERTGLKRVITYQMNLNDLVYFLSRDFILLMWAHIGWLFSEKKIIAGMLVRFAIGKILDEVFHPFGYWWGELLWDIGVVIWACYKWVQVNKKW